MDSGVSGAFASVSRFPGIFRYAQAPHGMPGTESTDQRGLGVSHGRVWLTSGNSETQTRRALAPISFFATSITTPFPDSSAALPKPSPSNVRRPYESTRPDSRRADMQAARSPTDHQTAKWLRLPRDRPGGDDAQHHRKHGHGDQDRHHLRDLHVRLVVLPGIIARGAEAGLVRVVEVEGITGAHVASVQVT